MVPTSLILIMTAALNALIGVLVFFNNPQRSQNRQFLFFSLNVSIWGLFIYFAISSNEVTYALYLIKAASYLAALIPVTFYLLCISIDQPAKSLRDLLFKARGMIFFSQMAGIICFTPMYLKGVVIPESSGYFPEAQYGFAFYIYNLYFVISFGVVIARFVISMRKAVGVKRYELQFIVLGFALTLVFALNTQIFIPLITGSSRTQPFGPLSILAMNAIIAYGIATQRIMGVGHILRRFVAYGILLVYLGALYAVCWLMFNALIPYEPGDFPFAHLMATIIVALSLAPAHGRLQQFAKRLFITVQTVDLEKTLQESNSILQSVTRLDSLLNEFGRMLEKALGTDRVVLMLREHKTLCQAYPSSETSENHALSLETHEPLASVLQQEREPLVVDLLARRRQSPALQAVSKTMKEWKMAAASGIHYKGELEGIILLGPRLSGRIYGATEQDLLKLLGNQLGVAIENAKLYTEVQDSKIYNNILLDSLVSGVIAADRNGIITVFNREAQRIMRASHSLTGEHIKCLPPPLTQTLQTTLDHRQAIRDRDAEIVAGSNTVSIRCSSTGFWGHQGAYLGALVVFSDMTQLKTLEEQIRRNDRLASIGTLSAGMAHEIKNPLVSIKTFTELLPERYDDADFRETFSSLVGAEVIRIDRIVNQLLRFARPAKPVLKPISLHDVINNSLRLMDQQLRTKHIQLNKFLNAESHIIQGDANLLEQAIINFILNAIDAMGDHGQLTIQTAFIQQDQSLPGFNAHKSNTDDRIQLQIKDSGKGITAYDLEHIFDPFFTTKGHGTGLGLSVSHGIIQEHGGVVSVDSKIGQGTQFSIIFPLTSEPLLTITDNKQSN
jgi:nitrogen-specific signal transduction histidine kinase